MKRNTFVFYKEWSEAIKDLPDDVRLEIYESIIEYATTGNFQGLKPMAKIAFNFIKADLDRDTEKYLSTTARNKANGSKGGRPKKEPQNNPNNPLGFDETQGNPKNLDNDNEYDNDFKESSKELKKDDFGKFVEVEISKCRSALKSDTSWRNTVVMNCFRRGNKNFTETELENFLDLFFMELQDRGETVKSEKDAKFHFANWLKLELKKQQKQNEADWKPSKADKTRKLVSEVANLDLRASENMPDEQILPF